jgi:SAM-dependent methyltransferase
MTATLTQKHAFCAAQSFDRAELLRRFVEMYWLRPENALWMTLRSEALRTIELARPSIDVSCGDGVFSFLHMGGRFDPAFDVFTSVDHLDRVRTQHADMFDAAGPNYQPKIQARPQERFDIGADCKAAMLAKAKTLHFYGELVEQDNNHPLQFDNESFATIYCNAAYWVRIIDSFLSELGRIIRSDGKIVLQVKLDSMRRYTLSQFKPVLGERFLDLIDRGRMDCWPSLTDRATWEQRFADAGLSIVSAIPLVTRTHSHLWDIGLRPIAPQLVRMANALSPATRAEIKRDWVDLFCELLTPLCDPALDLFPGNDEPAEMQYVLMRG